MKKYDAFLEIPRQNRPKQNVARRIGHYHEMYEEMAEEELRRQAWRCMDCGTPFCHGYGCPLGNVIPEWNELMFRGQWREASNLLHLTNNFPEITGRVCPALCEAACTLGLNDEPVTIRQNELAIVERGWLEGWIKPHPPKVNTGKSVAVLGSGPAGLATAQQLRRAGHQVVVLEKADRPGGILRYGIPDFKLEKSVLNRRLDQMKAEGVVFDTQVTAGVDISAAYLKRRFDALCLCVGAGVPRDLPVPGRELAGIHQAMDYLIQANRRVAGLEVGGLDILATGKKVVIIGGGDTGADCLGTAHRQKALSVHQLEILPRPPLKRDSSTPWPRWPYMLRSSPAHEEGGERLWSVATESFSGQDGQVTHLHGYEVRWHTEAGGRQTMSRVEGSDFTMDADLVILAMGFTRPEHNGLLDHLGVEYDSRGNVKIDENLMTSVKGVFAAGDACTGPSLVVRAIAAGRRLARRVDIFLTGDSALPDVLPSDG